MAKAVGGGPHNTKDQNRTALELKESRQGARERRRHRPKMASPTRRAPDRI